MTTFKKAVLFLHRWLGLITGVVVFILSVTGCLFAFQQEITGWYRYDLEHVDGTYGRESAGSPEPMPLDSLRARARNALDVDRLPYGLTTYREQDRNWSALLYTYRSGAWTYFGMAEEYKTLFINPYNGEVEGIANEKSDFFQIVKGIHWSLLLATPIGQPIVTWSTVIFILLLISGMVLWWPKRWDRTGRRKSFRIKWKGSWRRVNYDMHNVIGFYFLLLSLLIAFTGLYWYFPSAKKALHFIGTGEFVLPADPAPKEITVASRDGSVIQGKAASSPMQRAYRKAWSEYPRAWSITFTAPADSAAPLSATVRPDGETYYGNSELWFDSHTGELLGGDRYADKNRGEKLLSMNYDIHIGAIGGLPGKIMAFLASLVCASLPLTGFIIWWDRRKRNIKSRGRRPRP